MSALACRGSPGCRGAHRLRCGGGEAPSMRRSIRRLLFGSAVLCAIAAAVLATILVAPRGASAQAGLESITNYDTRIAIQRDGSILVTEQIVYDFGPDERHGIIREIPVRFRYNGSYDRIYRLEVR